MLFLLAAIGSLVKNLSLDQLGLLPLLFPQFLSGCKIGFWRSTSTVNIFVVDESYLMELLGLVAVKRSVDVTAIPNGQETDRIDDMKYLS